MEKEYSDPYELNILKAKDIQVALLRIRPSKKYKGIGVFALRDLEKGTILCDAGKGDDHHFITHEEYEKLDPITQEVVYDFCAQDKDGYYGPQDLNYLSIPMHMNHSCDGNVGGDGEGNFVAIRDVAADEELCFDYALVISNPNYRFKCRCGSENCRKIVTGNDWMDPQFIKLHYKHMSPLMQELVDEKFN